MVMTLKYLTFFLLLLILYFRSSAVLSACSPSLIAEGNDLLMLSDDLLDADNAEQKCKSYGGILATISDPTTNNKLLNALSKYTKVTFLEAYLQAQLGFASMKCVATDLTRVWIFDKGSRSEYMRYSTNENIPNSWQRPNDSSTPQFIDLLTNSAKDLHSVYFCSNSDDAWSVTMKKCSSGGSTQFILYGRNSTVPGFKPIYLYRHIFSYRTVRILINRSPFHLYFDLTGTTYIPDRNVFIGLRFDSSSKIWLWSNRSKTNFDTSSLSGCQHKAWHYGDKWELVNKKCSTEKAFYICYLKDLFQPIAEQNSCRPDVVVVRWKRQFEKLTATISGLAIKIEAFIEGRRSGSFVDHPVSLITISNLNPLTKYNINMRATLLGCANTVLNSLIEVETGFGTPVPISNARILPEWGCFVEIPAQSHNPNNLRTKQITIVAKSKRNETVHIFPASEQSMNKALLLHDHGCNEKVEFKVKAVSGNCSSPFVSIRGHCFSPGLQSWLTMNGKMYIQLNETLDAEKAAERCSSLGGHLITFEENETADTFGNSLILQTKDKITFIGARFNTSTKKWIWSDGTIADFNTSGLNTCQQKGLRYGSAWELIDLDCVGIKAYYACQFKMELAASSHSLCKSSVVQFSWKDALLRLLESTGRELTVKINTHDSSGSEITHSVPFTRLKTSFTGLEQGKQHTFKIRVALEECTNFNVESIKTLVTANGIPEINTANVSSATPCVVRVEHARTDLDVTYNISADNSTRDVTLKNCKNSALTTICNFTMREEEWAAGSKIYFQVALSTCSGTSESVHVEGYCSISPSSIAGMIGYAFGGILGSFFLIGLIVFVVNRRKRGRMSTVSQQIAFVRSERTVTFGKAYSAQKKPFANGKESDCSQNYPEDLETHAYEDIDTDSSFKEDLEAKPLYQEFLQNSENGYRTFKKEFEEIEVHAKSHNAFHASKVENAARNRYRKNFPYDHARVIVEDQADNDYINASYMPGYSNDGKFIATQGPLPTTVNDFWLMTWQQQSDIIIMLTNCTERNEMKCEQYWPLLDRSSSFRDIKVTTKDETSIRGIIQRKFVLCSNVDSGRKGSEAEKRNVTQFHYGGWPGFSIPTTTSQLIYLRQMVEKIYDKRHPIIVHCSTGSGRTGTYIAMDFLFDQLDAEGKVDVQQCVAKMRENRTDMVQNLKQYTFLYKMVLEYHLLPDSDRTDARVQGMSSRDIATLAQEEYKLLNCWRFGEKWERSHASSTTYPHNRIVVKMEETGEMRPQNASQIEGLFCPRNLIAAQVPQDGKQEEFWNMILMKDARVVVCLEKEVNFWMPGSNSVFGDIEVTVDEYNNYQTFSVIDLSVSSIENYFEPEEVTVFHLSSWSEGSGLPRATDLIKLVEHVMIAKEEEEKVEVLVCCRDGCSKTGTLIAAISLLERLKIEKRVDVLRTVKDLRDMRPNMVNQPSLYAFCYTIVLDFLSSFGGYDNYGLRHAVQ